jgi:glycosyltransferase involved in cell wall biosynthesis
LAPDLPDLYIAGDLGSQRKAVFDVARASKVDHRIHLLGRISDDQLRERYAGAALCVQPSLYEGFGLQPLEALACGAPLIVFPEPSVEEVVGDAAVIAKDRDETSLANCIARLWDDTELRSALQEDGPRRAAVFSWTRTATLVADLLVEMVGHRRAYDDAR